MKKGSLPWYAHNYQYCILDAGREKQVEFVCKRALANKGVYQDVKTRTGVPMWLVAAIHNLEANADFKAVLHNGEKIIGTGAKTKLVPKGRGPFKTWQEAAIDALIYDGLNNFKAWPIEVCLKVAEQYNGLGYMQHHKMENSPYVWACTSMNDGTGKYKSDGKWSEDMPSESQVGVAAFFKGMMLLSSEELIDKFGHVN